MHWRAIGKTLYPSFVQRIGHGGGNNEARYKNANILPIEHHKNASCGSTEDLADANLLALGACLEEDEAENSDEGDEEGDDGDEH